MRLIINTTKKSSSTTTKYTKNDILQRRLLSSSTSSRNSKTAVSLLAFVSSPISLLTTRLSSNTVAAFSSIIVPNVKTYNSNNKIDVTSSWSLILQSGQKLQQSSPASRSTSTTTRHFSSRGSNNDSRNKNDSSIIQKGINTVTNIAKSILPTSWFRTEEEKQQAIKRQEVKNTVKSGINEILRDAPLPIRMLGRNVLSPLVGNLMSGISETISQQQSSIDTVLDSVTLLLQNDSTVIQLFNNQIPIVGTPYSQSSSSISINGQMTTKIELAFPITNDYGNKQGIGRVVSSNGIINTLVIDIDGRRIPINTSINSDSSTTSSTTTYFAGTSSSSTRQSKRPYADSNNDNIIEAEIIEKTKK
jgi:hypothetical protein